MNRFWINATYWEKGGPVFGKSNFNGRFGVVFEFYGRIFDGMFFLFFY